MMGGTMSQTQDAVLRVEIDTFDRMRGELEQHHMHKWVLIYGVDLVDTFDNFENAAQMAVCRFGRGPYLIRQVGADEKIRLPASVMFAPAHAAN